MSIVESVKNITDVPATSECCVFGRCEVALPNLLSLNFVMFPLSVVCFAVLLAGLLWRWLQRSAVVRGSQELVAFNPMQGQNSRRSWEEPAIDWRPLYACAGELSDESSDEPDLADQQIESPAGSFGGRDFDMLFEDLFGAEEDALVINRPNEQCMVSTRESRGRWEEPDINWTPFCECEEEHADDASDSSEPALPSAETPELGSSLESEESSEEDDYGGVDYTKGWYKPEERDRYARDNDRGRYNPEERGRYARDNVGGRYNPKVQDRPSVPFNLDTSCSGNSLEFTPSEPFRRRRPYVPAGIPTLAAAPTRTSLLREARAKAAANGKDVPRKRGAGKKMNVSSEVGNVEQSLNSTFEVDAEVALNTTFEMDKHETTLNTTFEVDKAEAKETSGEEDPVGSEVNANAASPSTSGDKCCSKCGGSHPAIWSPSSLTLSHEQESLVAELQAAVEYKPIEIPEQGLVNDMSEEAERAFHESFRTSHLVFMQLMQESLGAQRAQLESTSSTRNCAAEDAS